MFGFQAMRLGGIAITIASRVLCSFLTFLLCVLEYGCDGWTFMLGHEREGHPLLIVRL